MDRDEQMEQVRANQRLGERVAELAVDFEDVYKCMGYGREIVYDLYAIADDLRYHADESYACGACRACR